MGMYAIKLQFHQSKDGGEILIRRGVKSGGRWIKIINPPGKPGGFIAESTYVL
jgi:hypothetical protein